MISLLRPTTWPNRLLGLALVWIWWIGQTLCLEHCARFAGSNPEATVGCCATKHAARHRDHASQAQAAQVTQTSSHSPSVPAGVPVSCGALKLAKLESAVSLPSALGRTSVDPSSHAVYFVAIPPIRWLQLIPANGLPDSPRRQILVRHPHLFLGPGFPSHAPPVGA